MSGERDGELRVVMIEVVSGVRSWRQVVVVVVERVLVVVVLSVGTKLSGSWWSERSKNKLADKQTMPPCVS